MKITGVTLTDLHRAGDTFAARTRTELRAVLRSITREWGSSPTLDSLAPIRDRWDGRVDAKLMPHVADAYWAAVNAVAVPIIDHLNGLAAAAPPSSGAARGGPLDDPGLPAAAAGGVKIARVSNLDAQAYLADARNRLARVGDEIWEHARGELLEGMQKGEGIGDLAVRVSSVAADLAEPRAEVIARTEVNGASNAGALDQVLSLNLPATKTWIATGDERTRPAHAEADGQIVDVTAKFDVGGEEMDRPHDETASAGNTVDCRCTVSFEITEDALSGLLAETASAVTAAADAAMTGAMIALVPSAADLDRLPIDGGETRDDLHLTLWFLGEAADYNPLDQDIIITALRGMFAGFGPIEARAFGAALWNPDGDSPAMVLNVGNGETDQDSLHDAYETAGQAILASVDFERVPAQHSPWSPHICLAYSADLGLMDDMIKRVGPVTFDLLRVAFAGDVTDIPMSE